MLHDIGLPTLGVPRGAECLGANVVLETHLMISFFTSVFLLFSLQFSRDISLRSNMLAGALYL